MQKWIVPYNTCINIHRERECSLHSTENTRHHPKKQNCCFLSSLLLLLLLLLSNDLKREEKCIGPQIKRRKGSDGCVIKRNPE